jgi:archaellum component FlaC
VIIEDLILADLKRIERRVDQIYEDMCDVKLRMTKIETDLTRLEGPTDWGDDINEINTSLLQKDEDIEALAGRVKRLENKT